MAVEIIRHRRSRVDKNEEDVYKSYASHEFFSVDDLILMVNVFTVSIVPNQRLPVRIFFHWQPSGGTEPSN